MKAELIEWANHSLSPVAGVVVAVAALLAPLAAEIGSGAAQGPSPEWTERMIDRLSGPAGATVLGVVVIYFMFKLLMELIGNMKQESVKKDETIAASMATIRELAERLGEKH